MIYKYTRWLRVFIYWSTIPITILYLFLMMAYYDYATTLPNWTETKRASVAMSLANGWNWYKEFMQS